MISWTMLLGHSVVKENITYSVLFTPYLFVSKKISKLLFNSMREREIQIEAEAGQIRIKMKRKRYCMSKKS